MIPPEISKLVFLKELDLSHNEISLLPGELFELANLQILNLAYNQISDLPVEVVHLHDLRDLLLDHNLLHELPVTIVGKGEVSGMPLDKLQTLSVSHNHLAKLPRELNHLKLLRVLRAHHNRITELPRLVSELLHIRVIDVHANDIKVLPMPLMNRLAVPKSGGNGVHVHEVYLPLESLACHDNHPDMVFPPKGIVTEGGEKVVQYLRSDEGRNSEEFAVARRHDHFNRRQSVVALHVLDSGPLFPFEILTHRGGMRSLAFSPVGMMLATSGEDGCAHLINLRTGDIVRTLVHDPQASTGAGAGATSRLSSTASATSRLSSTASVAGAAGAGVGGGRAAEKGGAAGFGSINCVAFSPDGRTVATCGDDRLIWLWVVETGKQRPSSPMAGHMERVYVVAWRPDGAYIASCGYDNRIIVWNVGSGRMVCDMVGHQGFVRCCVWSSDSKFLASAGYDETVRVWDVSNMQAASERVCIRKQSGLSVAFLPGGGAPGGSGLRLVSSGGKKSVEVWDVGGRGGGATKLTDTADLLTECGVNPGSKVGRGGEVGCVSVSGDGMKMAAAEGMTIRVFSRIRHLDGSEGEFSLKFEIHGHNGRGGCRCNTELKTGWHQPVNPECPIFGHASGVTVLAFSADGKTIASGSESGSARLWDAATGKSKSTLSMLQMGEALSGRTGSMRGGNTIGKRHNRRGSDISPLSPDISPMQPGSGSDFATAQFGSLLRSTRRKSRGRRHSIESTDSNRSLSPSSGSSSKWNTVRRASIPKFGGHMTTEEAFRDMRLNFGWAFGALSELGNIVESFQEGQKLTTVQFIVTECYPLAVVLKITNGGKAVMRYMLPSDGWLQTVMKIAGDETKVYLKVCLPKEGHRGTELPEGTESWTKLTVLDVTGNNMKTIRVTDLMKLPHFESLHCTGNLRLFSPPPEISVLGGMATVAYLREAARTGRTNHQIQLMTLGNGESGKTSVVSALQSKDNCAVEIHEDDRTVGIAMSTWRPETDSPLEFVVKDLAGQAVYTLTNQFFLARRALYMLVWRVAEGTEDKKRQEKELKDMIELWMDTLQMRIPGASMVLVVTHIDLVEDMEVNLQCEWVKDVVNAKLSAMVAADGSILPLDVADDGDSWRVDCLHGTGVEYLRWQLTTMAHTLPWYGEIIPGPYIDLWSAVQDKTSDDPEGNKWLDWDKYRSLAEENQVGGVNLGIATKLLSELGVIKYFGDVDQAAKKPLEKMSILERTVFVSPEWIIDALKGLIRHDRDALLMFFSRFAGGMKRRSSLMGQAAENKLWLRRIHRLAVYGCLHVDLVQYIWPSSKKSDKYWEWARQREALEREEQAAAEEEGRLASRKSAFSRRGSMALSRRASVASKASSSAAAEEDKIIFFNQEKDGVMKQMVAPGPRERESKLWERDVAETEEDYQKILSLLEGCDIIHNISHFEYMAPALLTRTQTARLDARVYSKRDCLFQLEVEFPVLPPGFFERLVVRCRRRYSHADFSSNVAAFYGRGLKAQIFITDLIIETPHLQRVSNGMVTTSVDSLPFRGSARSQLIREGTMGGLEADAKNSETQWEEYEEEEEGEDPNEGKLMIMTEVLMTIMTSTRAQMAQIERELAHLRAFFPGVTLKENARTLDDMAEAREPTQLRILEPNTFGFQYRDKIKESLDQVDEQQAEEEAATSGKGRKTLPLLIDASRGFEYEQVDSRIVLVCMVESLQHPSLQDALKAMFRGDATSVRFQTDCLTATWGGQCKCAKAIELLQKQESFQRDEALGEKKKLDEMEKLVAAGMEEHRTDAINQRRVVGILDSDIELLESTVTFLRELESHIKHRRVLIPVIMPGYSIANPARWWPEYISELEENKLFIDCRRINTHEGGLDKEELLKVMRESFGQIHKRLEDWRGDAPDPEVFREVSEEVECPKCIASGGLSIGKFNRNECEEMVRGQVATSAAGSAVKATAKVTCCNGHENVVLDVLSRSVIYDAVPCPQCVRQAKPPPYCFSRQDCLLYFTEDNKGKAGTVVCKKCEEEGRPCNIRIMDLFAPEVFLSYNWGVFDDKTKTFSTQELVRPLRGFLEYEADVMCWFDVEGGMSAGEDFVSKMREGIRKCTVVVIFLSDAYLNSDNCKREFIYASRFSKHIVPVLVPPGGRTNSGYNAGWTGPRPEKETDVGGTPQSVPGKEGGEWWRHAVSMCKECVDPDNKKMGMSWSNLGRFDAVDMQEMGEGPTRAEVMQRIASKFHRGHTY